MSSLGFQPTATCDIWGRGSLFYTLILYIYIYIHACSIISYYNHFILDKTFSLIISFKNLLNHKIHIPTKYLQHSNQISSFHQITKLYNNNLFQQLIELINGDKF